MSSQPHLQSVQGSHARFEAGDVTTDNGATPPAPPGSGDSGDSGRSSKAAARPRAEKPLPTDRLKFDNQVRVLQAVAATSGNNRRGSTAEAMSAAIDLRGGTGGLNSRFFKAAGWFEPVGRGEYTASAGVLAWNQHVSIDPDAHFEAAAQMRQEVQRSWFWETLHPILASGQPISTKLALLELAKSAGASQHGSQLDTIIDWIEWVGLVDRLDDRLRLRVAAPAEEQSEGESGAVDVVDVVVEEQAPDDTTDRAPESEDEDVRSTSAPLDTDAIVSFNMSVRLTADDLRGLDGDQREFLLSLAERLRG